MEQETKIKKQPNLKRVILWTTLISIVAMLVLYYFSYIFPIPAVEIDATGIPQTKEEYEQQLFKEKISMLLGDKKKFDFGDKIIQFIDLDSALYGNFCFVYSKSNQHWIYARIALLNLQTKTNEPKYLNFQIEGSEVIGHVGLNFDNLYIYKKNMNPQFLVFNRDKEKVYYYTLDGKIEKTDYLSKDCKMGFDSHISMPMFVLGKGIFIENSENMKTINNIKDWDSNNVCIIKYVSEMLCSDIYVLSNNSLKNYIFISDIPKNEILSSANIDDTYSDISFGLPIVNSLDGVYYLDKIYTYDKEKDCVNKIPRFIRILDKSIDKESIIYSDLCSVMFGKQIGDHYYVYFIDCRDYAGSGDYYGENKYNVLMWKFVVPGIFKWYSKYSNIFCTDKGIFTIPCLYRKLYTPYQMHFDNNEYESKFPYELKTNVQVDFIDEYPHDYLFGKGNFALKPIITILGSIYDDLITNIYATISFLIICIILFILVKCETKKKPENKS